MLETIDHAHVRELRMARPPANALNPALIRALGAAVGGAAADGAAALVLSGSPGMFSAGLDVPELLTLDRPQMVAAWTDFFNLNRAIATSPIPVVAAITGHAPAGGAVLSVFCDYRVMAEGKFRIGFNEVRVGLPLPEVIHAALVHAVGGRHAERLGVSGELIFPERALAVGLVDEMVPTADVVPRALAWCDAYLALPPQATATTRALARAPVRQAFAALDAAAVDAFVDIWFSDETQGAMRALVARLAKK